MKDEVNETMSAIAADSRLGHGILRLRRIGLAAWDASTTARIFRRSHTGWAGLTAAQRVRFVALLVAWVSASQLIALWVLPRYVISGLPAMWFLAVAVLATLTGVMAAPLTSAWPDSRVAKTARSFFEARG